MLKEVRSWRSVSSVAMDHRLLRFVDNYAPCGGGARPLTVKRFNKLMSGYCPFEYTDNVVTQIKNRFSDFGIDPNGTFVKTNGEVVTFDFSTAENASRAVLTLYTMSPLFYTYFSEETRDLIFQNRLFQNYNFRYQYCLMDMAYQKERVHLGNTVIFRGKNKNVVDNRLKIRFYQFASASTNRSVVDYHDSVYEIANATVMPISRYSLDPEESEYLIHPYDIFTLTRYREENGVTADLVLSRGARHDAHFSSTILLCNLILLSSNKQGNFYKLIIIIGSLLCACLLSSICAE